MSEDNSVFIGRKPAMNYVLAVVTQFNKGSDRVVVKARGKSISRAVDVVEIVRKRFINDLEIENINIGTEKLQLDDKNVNVSSMEITLARKEGTSGPLEKTDESQATVSPSPEEITE